jgi:ATP-dependent Clp protease protease subunit
MAKQTQTRKSPKSFDRGRDSSALTVRALNHWNPQMRVVRADAGATVIELYDVIGADYWSGGGITAEWMADQIRGRGDLVVNINSPGGDFFEGLAIYNLLKGHAGKKTVNIIGLAASAASLIAAAGDDVLIGAAAYVMIHNTWGLVIGDKNDMADAAKAFEKFDQGARVIYAMQSGKPDAEIAQLMDDETWMLGQEAVDQGFATGLLAADAVVQEAAQTEGDQVDEPADPEADPAQARNSAGIMALRQAEAILCQSMTRADARKMLNQIKGGKPDAVAQGKPGAAKQSALADGLRGLLQTLETGKSK